MKHSMFKNLFVNTDRQNLSCRKWVVMSIFCIFASMGLMAQESTGPELAWDETATANGITHMTACTRLYLGAPYTGHSNVTSDGEYDVFYRGGVYNFNEGNYVKAKVVNASGTDEYTVEYSFEYQSGATGNVAKVYFYENEDDIHRANPSFSTTALNIDNQGGWCIAAHTDLAEPIDVYLVATLKQNTTVIDTIKKPLTILPAVWSGNSNGYLMELYTNAPVDILDDLERDNNLEDILGDSYIVDFETNATDWSDYFSVSDGQFTNLFKSGSDKLFKGLLEFSKTGYLVNYIYSEVTIGNPLKSIEMPLGGFENVVFEDGNPMSGFNITGVTVPDNYEDYLEVDCSSTPCKVISTGDENTPDNMTVNVTITDGANRYTVPLDVTVNKDYAFSWAGGAAGLEGMTAYTRLYIGESPEEDDTDLFPLLQYDNTHRYVTSGEDYAPVYNLDADNNIYANVTAPDGSEYTVTYSLEKGDNKVYLYDEDADEKSTIGEGFMEVSASQSAVESVNLIATIKDGDGNVIGKSVKTIEVMPQLKPENSQGLILTLENDGQVSVADNISNEGMLEDCSFAFEFPFANDGSELNSEDYSGYFNLNNGSLSADADNYPDDEIKCFKGLLKTTKTKYLINHIYSEVSLGDVDEVELEWITAPGEYVGNFDYGWGYKWFNLFNGNFDNISVDAVAENNLGVSVEDATIVYHIIDARGIDGERTSTKYLEEGESFSDYTGEATIDAEGNITYIKPGLIKVIADVDPASGYQAVSFISGTINARIAPEDTEVCNPLSLIYGDDNNDNKTITINTTFYDELCESGEMCLEDFPENELSIVGGSVPDEYSEYLEIVEDGGSYKVHANKANVDENGNPIEMTIYVEVSNVDNDGDNDGYIDGLFVPLVVTVDKADVTLEVDGSEVMTPGSSQTVVGTTNNLELESTDVVYSVDETSAAKGVTIGEDGKLVIPSDVDPDDLQQVVVTVTSPATTNYKAVTETLTVSIASAPTISDITLTMGDETGVAPSDPTGMPTVLTVESVTYEIPDDEIHVDITEGGNIVPKVAPSTDTPVEVIAHIKTEEGVTIDVPIKVTFDKADPELSVWAKDGFLTDGAVFYISNDPTKFIEFDATSKATEDGGTITIVSSDTDIATIDENGVLHPTGNAYGTITVTVTSPETTNYVEETQTYTVNVYPTIGNVSVYVDEYVTDLGEYSTTADFIAFLQDKGYTVSYSYSATEDVAVDANNKISHKTNNENRGSYVRASVKNNGDAVYSVGFYYIVNKHDPEITVKVDGEEVTREITESGKTIKVIYTYTGASVDLSATTTTAYNDPTTETPIPVVFGVNSVVGGSDAASFSDEGVMTIQDDFAGHFFLRITSPETDYFKEKSSLTDYRVVVFHTVNDGEMYVGQTMSLNNSTNGIARQLITFDGDEYDISFEIDGENHGLTLDGYDIDATNATAGTVKFNAIVKEKGGTDVLVTLPFEVTVKKATPEVTLNQPLDMTINAAGQTLSATTNSNGAISYYIDNTGCSTCTGAATIDADGTIHPTKAGKIQVYASTAETNSYEAGRSTPKYITIFSEPDIEDLNVAYDPDKTTQDGVTPEVISITSDELGNKPLNGYTVTYSLVNSDDAAYVTLDPTTGTVTPTGVTPTGDIEVKASFTRDGTVAIPDVIFNVSVDVLKPSAKVEFETWSVAETGSTSTKYNMNIVGMTYGTSVDIKVTDGNDNPYSEGSGDGNVRYSVSGKYIAPDGEHDLATIDPVTGVLTPNDYTGTVTVTVTIPETATTRETTAEYDIVIGRNQNNGLGMDGFMFVGQSFGLDDLFNQGSYPHEFENLSELNCPNEDCNGMSLIIPDAAADYLTSNEDDTYTIIKTDYPNFDYPAYWDWSSLSLTLVFGENGYVEKSGGGYLVSNSNYSLNFLSGFEKMKLTYGEPPSLINFEYISGFFDDWDEELAINGVTVPDDFANYIGIDGEDGVYSVRNINANVDDDGELVDMPVYVTCTYSWSVEDNTVTIPVTIPLYVTVAPAESKTVFTTAPRDMYVSETQTVVAEAQKADGGVIDTTKDPYTITYSITDEVGNAITWASIDAATGEITATGSGTVIVTATSTFADGNYTTSSVTSSVVTIIADPTVAPIDMTYNDPDVTPTPSGADGLSVHYVIPDGTAEGTTDWRDYLEVVTVTDPTTGVTTEQIHAKKANEAGTPEVPVEMTVNAEFTTPNGNTIVVPFTVTVAKDDANITWPNTTETPVPNYQESDINITLDAYVTEDNSLPITYEVVSDNAEVNNGTLTITGTGEVVVKASFAGNDNYNPDEETWTFTVSPEPLTITICENGKDGDGKPIIDDGEPDGVVDFEKFAAKGRTVVNTASYQATVTTELVDLGVLSTNYNNVTFTIAAGAGADATKAAVINGKLDAYRLGTYPLTITATAGNGATATCTLSINIPRGTMKFEKADGNWSEHTGWHRPDIIPLGINHNVEISKNCTVDIVSASDEVSTTPIYTDQYAACYDLNVTSGGYMEVATDAALEVLNTLSNAGNEDNILIKAEEEKAGSVWFLYGSPKATVELYGYGTKPEEQQYPIWQYRGIPVTVSEITAATSTSGTYNGFGLPMIYQWSEHPVQSQQGNYKENWTRIMSGEIDAWTGYTFAKLTDETPSGYTVYAKGVLYAGNLNDGSTLGHEFTLVETDADNGESHYNQGYNLVTNSYAAPIDLGEFEASDFGADVDATVYFFNHASDWTYRYNHKHDNLNGTGEGQIITWPIFSGEAANRTTGASLSTIASGQSFFVHTNVNNGTFKLRHAALKHNSTNGKLLAPREEENFNILEMFVDGDEMCDRLVLMENERCSNGYDNGYDGVKRINNGNVPQLYATNEFGNTAINVDEKIIGQYVGFKAAKNGIHYTISFNTDRLEGYEWLYLYDNKEKKYTNILKGETYTFTGTFSGEEKRFIIVGEREDGSKSTGFDQRIEVIGNQAYVSGFDGISEMIFIVDMSGKMVWQSNTAVGPWFDLPDDLPDGVYVIKAADCQTKFVK